MTKNRRYYAAQSPRGFSNEVYVYAFSTKGKRDAWVKAHENDGDTRSAYCGAYRITRPEALRIGGPSYDGSGFPDRTRPNATFIA